MANKFEPPYYAVIFTSKRNAWAENDGMTVLNCISRGSNLTAHTIAEC